MDDKEQELSLEASRVTIRPFEERDRPFIRAICKKTGQKGNPTWIFFEDEEIMPILVADYYMDYEPESCFVADIDGRVIGYLLGCKDSHLKAWVMFSRVYPRLFLRILWRAITFRYRKKGTYQTLWWIVSRSWRESFRIPDEYPAHAHFNLEAAYRGMGIGERLTEAFRAHRLERGILGMHVIVREEEGDDSLVEFLCRGRGFRLLDTRENTLWQNITGKRWYAKLLVSKLPAASKTKNRANCEH